MDLIFDSGDRPVDFLLHPTDLSEASERAFDHALAIAIRTGAQLTILHAAGRRASDNWSEFPSVRAKLARWRAAGTTEGLEDRIRKASISKLESAERDPVAASKRYLERHPVDMLVVATQGRTGLSRLFKPSTAERLARETRLLTMFVPAVGRGFVDGDTGEVTLERILLPIDPSTDPRPAMLRAVRSAAILDDPSLEITLLHVGDAGETRISDVPDLPYCRWNVVQKTGPVVDEILEMAEEIQADAIYMSTTWDKPSFGRSDGGITEGVLSGAACPVATVPVSEP
ncbi:MAG: hypothetical protein AMS19_03455 [Gemmatimonas sp. SG8_23]|nr:MAG: hypothetical protein AMS19_03455 [Gemmatimonas sp. SG8_23]